MRFQLQLALRYLSGRKVRTVLTTLAIVFGVMVFGVNGVVPAVKESFRRNLMAAASVVDLTITSESGGVFDADVTNAVQNTPGVACAMGALVRPVALPAAYAPATSDGQPVTSFMVNGLDPVTAAEVRRVSVTKGRFFGPADSDVVAVSDRFAARTGLDVGDVVRLPSASGATAFLIVGVVAERPTPGAEELYMPLAAAQRLFNQPGQINTIEALFAPDGDPVEIRQAVLERLGPGYRAGGAEAGDQLSSLIEMGGFVFNMFGIMSLAMGAFIIFITFRTVVAERRRDIGMLRAIGASRGTILGLLLAEGLLQGVAGTAIGLVAGRFLITGMMAVMGPLWERQVHFPLGNPSLTPSTYLISIVLGVGAALLGAAYPALSASRIPPLEALRPVIAGTTGRVTRRRSILGAALVVLAMATLIPGDVGLASLGAILFLVGLLVLGPALVRPISVVFGRLLAAAFAREGHVAQGNLAADPVRAATTASAMTIGLAIVVGVTGLVTSMYSASWEYLRGSVRSDYLLMPQSLVLGGGNVGAGPELAQALRDTPGVGALTTLRATRSRVGGEDVQVIGIDPELYPELSGLKFSAGDPRQAFAELRAGRAVIVNDILATPNGLAPGTEATFETPEGPRVYRVAGVGTEFINMKFPTAYISQDNLERDFHETTDLLIMADAAPGANRDQVRAAIGERVRDYPAFSLVSSEEWLQSQRTDINAKMGAVFVLLAVLAVPSLIALANALVISVLERTREIGMLRAIGATRRQVQRIIVAESLLLAGAGTAFGILGGIWLGYIFVGAMNAGGLRYEYYFPYSGILLAVATGLSFGVLGALIPARQAARLNIVAALQHE